MIADQGLVLRLQFLTRLVGKEIVHLQSTDRRLFAEPFTVAHVIQMDDDPDLAERVDAFVSRFGRLQDTAGDKLLPTLLRALGESPAALIDNLDKAEALRLVASADDWLTMRKLRNQMVHEYIEDPEILVSALQSAHVFVPSLIDAAQNMADQVKSRWTPEDAN